MKMHRRHSIQNRVKLSQFARQLLAEWRRLHLPVKHESIGVAVSGGADSTALLLGLDELKSAGKISVDLIVAHLDHGLRQRSAKDAKWVSELAKRLGYATVTAHKNVREAVNVSGDNLEQMARKVRYDFLERTARVKKCGFVVTGHTMDDQAETVLLRLMRGSASLGLGGIEGIRHLSVKGDIHLARPLLWARRTDTESYCRSRHQEFLCDEMNADEAFARVRVRKRLLPLMESFNSRVVEAISRTATLLREDSAVLYENAAELLKKARIPGSDVKNKTKVSALDVHVLSGAPAALRRRALRQWISESRGNARQLEMVHLLAVERLLEGTAGDRVAELPAGGRVRRRRSRLEYAVKND
jgi:tRNA(Ile)-lysidine synthase